jgi:hypothetical protein
MIRLSEWAKLPLEERRKAIADAKPNGVAARIEAEICEFEDRFGFDSAEMRRQLDAQELQETWDVCQWLTLLHRRELLGQARTE